MWLATSHFVYYSKYIYISPPLAEKITAISRCIPSGCTTINSSMWQPASDTVHHSIQNAITNLYSVWLITFQVHKYEKKLLILSINLKIIYPNSEFTITETCKQYLDVNLQPENRQFLLIKLMVIYKVWFRGKLYLWEPEFIVVMN